MVPDISTIQNSIASRGNKVYLDSSQNDYADTLACAYSARPYHQPRVSTPLEWKEINTRLVLSAFTIKTILPRIRKKGELFADFQAKKWIVHNNRILKKL